VKSTAVLLWRGRVNCPALRRPRKVLVGALGHGTKKAIRIFVEVKHFNMQFDSIYLPR
jgi:hypothetical protein